VINAFGMLSNLIKKMIVKKFSLNFIKIIVTNYFFYFKGVKLEVGNFLKLGRMRFRVREINIEEKKQDFVEK